MANFGQARDTQNGGKMAELGAKMGPRWRQDGPRWGLAGHLEATWGVILSILGDLGADLCKKGRSIKMSTTVAALVTKWGLGGSWGVYLEALGAYFGRSWSQVGLTWAILALSWELLGDMLGTRWPKMA